MKGLLVKFILLTVALVVALCCIEIFLRISARFDFKTGHLLQRDKAGPEETRKKGIPEVCFYNNGWKNVYQPTITLGYEHVPNVGNINSMGLVGREYGLRKNKGVSRILLLGDSLAADDRIRVFLEENLNDSPFNAKDKFEIWNSGTPGWDIRKYALFLRHKGLKYQPDLVLVCLCLNDLNLYNTIVYYRTRSGTVGYEFPVHEITKVYVPNPYLLRKSYLYRYLVFKINNYLIGDDREDTKEEIYSYFEIIKEDCGKRDINVLAVIFPWLKPLEAYDQDELLQYKLMVDSLENLNFSFIDLHKYISDTERNALRNNKKDQIHLSEEGNRIVARIIYNYLIQSNII